MIKVNGKIIGEFEVNLEDFEQLSEMVSDVTNILEKVKSYHLGNNAKASARIIDSRIILSIEIKDMRDDHMSIPDFIKEVTEDITAYGEVTDLKIDYSRKKGK